jgi:hypothetical protein
MAMLSFKVSEMFSSASLDGKSLKHVSSFKYLGSTLSENGGMENETRYRILQSELCLNRYSSIWKSDLSLLQKVRFLNPLLGGSLGGADDTASGS